MRGSVLWSPNPPLSHTPQVVFLDLQRPGTHKVNISAFDLSKWHDTRFGSNPVVTKVTSAGGSVDHSLKHNAVYSLTLAYRDALLHDEGKHILSELLVEHDLVSLAPVWDWERMPADVYVRPSGTAERAPGAPATFAQDVGRGFCVVVLARWGTVDRGGA